MTVQYWVSELEKIDKAIRMRTLLGMATADQRQNVPVSWRKAKRRETPTPDPDGHINIDAARTRAASYYRSPLESVVLGSKPNFCGFEPQMSAVVLRKIVVI